MRVVIQRVDHALVMIENKVHEQIKKGFVLFVGFTHNDDKAVCDKLATKIAGLRIFSDEAGKMNKSLDDVGGEILSISQFTLYANCKKGKRPGFDQAQDPLLANELYLYFNKCLQNLGQIVKSGVFQADMMIELGNDGPVTIILDSDQL